MQIAIKLISTYIHIVTDFFMNKHNKLLIKALSKKKLEKPVTI